MRRLLTVFIHGFKELKQEMSVTYRAVADTHEIPSISVEEFPEYDLLSYSTRSSSPMPWFS